MIAVASEMLKGSQIIPPRTRNTPLYPECTINPLKEKITELEWLVDQKTQENQLLFNRLLGLVPICFLAGMILGVCIKWGNT